MADDLPVDVVADVCEEWGWVLGFPGGEMGADGFFCHHCALLSFEEDVGDGRGWGVGQYMGKTVSKSEISKPAIPINAQAQIRLRVHPNLNDSAAHWTWFRKLLRKRLFGPAYAEKQLPNQARFHQFEVVRHSLESAPESPKYKIGKPVLPAGVFSKSCMINLC
jgi:hypothetical protein